MKKVIIAIAMVVVLLFTAVLGYLSVGFRNFNVKTWRLKPATVESEVVAVDENGNEMNSTSVYEMPGAMLFKSGGTPDGVSVTLTATVYPETASNKTVDWSIAWQNPNGEFARGKTATDYATVTPTEDGSLTATVTCLQAFSTEIILVTVTTRDRGYTASCELHYIGKPSEVIVSSTIFGQMNDTDIYHIGKGVNYSFDFGLDNVFGVVGDIYKDYEIIASVNNEIICGNFYDVPASTAKDEWDGLSTVSEEFRRAITNKQNIFELVKNSEKMYFLVKEDYVQSLYAYYQVKESFLQTPIGGYGPGDKYINKVNSVANVDSLSITLKIYSKTFGESLYKNINLIIDETVVTGSSVNSGPIEF